MYIPETPLTYAGFKIRVDDEAMSKTVEDWSKVRSHGRAKRRLKRGYKQNIAYKIVPKTDIYQYGDIMIMHSEMLRELMLKMETTVGRSESRCVADNLSFRDRSKSEMPEYGFGQNYLWGRGLSNPYLKGIYNSWGP